MERRQFLKLMGLAAASLALQADPVLNTAMRLAEQSPEDKVMFYIIKKRKSGKWIIKATKYTDLNKKQLKWATWDVDTFRVLRIVDLSEAIEVRKTLYKQHLGIEASNVKHIDPYKSSKGAYKTQEYWKNNPEKLELRQQKCADSKKETLKWLKENGLYDEYVANSINKWRPKFEDWRKEIGEDAFIELCSKGGLVVLGKNSKHPDKFRIHSLGGIEVGKRRRASGYYKTEKFLQGCSKGGLATVESGLLEANREKIYSDVVCPKCGTNGSYRVMKRHHFDNCKLKPLLDALPTNVEFNKHDILDYCSHLGFTKNEMLGVIKHDRIKCVFKGRGTFPSMYIKL